jgi:hypothetical protein
MVACIDFFGMSEICWPKFIVRHSTSQNVQQKSTNRVNFIGNVRYCELFSRWLQ